MGTAILANHGLQYEESCFSAGIGELGLREQFFVGINGYSIQILGRYTKKPTYTEGTNLQIGKTDWRIICS